ncbi:MAG: hypothetical protein ACLQMT_01140 [Candidatus Acidiferrales bacterium]
MSKRQYTIELPASVGRRVNRAARRERRNPSDLAVEAFRWYFSSRDIPVEVPTPAEIRAIRRGVAALKRGDTITLNALRREEEMACRPRRSRAKIS